MPPLHATCCNVSTSKACILCDCPLQVFPKPYDLFNLALYGSMVVLAIVARSWLLLYIGVLTNAGNAAFMWVSDKRQTHRHLPSRGSTVGPK